MSLLMTTAIGLDKNAKAAVVVSSNLDKKFHMSLSWTAVIGLHIFFVFVYLKFSFTFVFVFYFFIFIKNK